MPERWPDKGRRVLTSDNIAVDVATAPISDIEDDLAGDQTLEAAILDPFKWMEGRDIRFEENPEVSLSQKPIPEVDNSPPVVLGGVPGEAIYFP